ncbi:MAG: hypothetical protein U9Q77_10395 [Candidatus Marinimicrobia bacterium]|nr:hypothetical protein [Candidatus Neomarinimicrobiota bacterium]
MAYRLEDHWLEKNRSIVELRHQSADRNAKELLKKRIEKYLASGETIEDAEYSETIIHKTPTHIDLYV